jgi:hypothetical protein
MIPTRTLIAVLVWLRARERISVIAFAFDIYVPRFVRFAIFFTCRFGLTGGEIVRDGAERDGRKVRLLGSVPGTRDKPDDVGAHDVSFQTAIATRPTSASEIRYAVIGFAPSAAGLFFVSGRLSLPLMN